MNAGLGFLVRGKDCKFCGVVDWEYTTGRNKYPEAWFTCTKRDELSEPGVFSYWEYSNYRIRLNPDDVSHDIPVSGTGLSLLYYADYYPDAPFIDFSGALVEFRPGYPANTWRYALISEGENNVPTDYKLSSIDWYEHVGQADGRFLVENSEVPYLNAWVRVNGFYQIYRPNLELLGDRATIKVWVSDSVYVLLTSAPAVKITSVEFDQDDCRFKVYGHLDNPTATQLIDIIDPFA